jgi:xylulokinase
MPTKDLSLAIDLGTGGPKVALVSKDGTVICHQHRKVETVYLGKNGAVQNPDSWWTEILSAATELLATDSSLGKRISCVSCTGQWGSTVPVGFNNEPVADCILWMDTRGHKYSKNVLKGTLPLSIEGYGIKTILNFALKTAGAPSTEGNDPLGHYLLIKNEMPEIYEKTKVFLEPVDYLGLRFTGNIAASPASMILSWLINVKRLQEPKYDKTLVKLSTRELDKLPGLVRFGSVVGDILPEIAERLGVDRDTKIITGCPDLISGAVGSGAVEDFDAHMAISTTSWMSCHVPFKKTDAFHQIVTVPGAFEGKYLLANNHETAGLCLAWLKEQLVEKIKGITLDFEELNRISEKANPGANGVIFAPWLAGERCPVYDRALRASFLNLSLNTQYIDIVRSLYEGVAFNARWMSDAVENMIKKKFDTVKLIGGGAASDVWCQIHADILNKEIHQVADPLLANVKGAGLLAFLYLGDIKKSDLAQKVKIKEVFHPDPGYRSLYDEIYETFKTIYKSQKNMYKTLNR